MTPSLPVDPTVDGPSPTELLRAVPSKTAFRRVLAAVELDDDVTDEREHALESLSQIELQRAANEVRFAAPQRIYYYRLPDLPHVDASDFEDLVETNSFGPQLRAVAEQHDRVYIVCSVPDGGTQAQLSISDESRETTVATFDPRTTFLAVRAESRPVADSTVRAISNHPALDDSHGLSLTENGFHGRFQDEYVEAYTRLVLETAGRTITADRLEITAERHPETGDRRDLRRDNVVGDLLTSGDTVEKHARVRLDFPELQDESDLLTNPRIRLSFEDDSIAFAQFVPERVLILLDQGIRSCYPG